MLTDDQILKLYKDETFPGNIFCHFSIILTFINNSFYVLGSFSGAQVIDAQIFLIVSYRKYYSILLTFKIKINQTINNFCAMFL